MIISIIKYVKMRSFSKCHSFLIISETTVISSKELLKMRDLSARSVLRQHKNDSTIIKNLAPQLGRGLQPGQEFSFEFSPSAVSKNTQNVAKVSLFFMLAYLLSLRHTIGTIDNHSNPLVTNGFLIQ